MDKARKTLELIESESCLSRLDSVEIYKSTRVIADRIGTLESFIDLLKESQDDISLDDLELISIGTLRTSVWDGLMFGEDVKIINVL